ncbi:MAG: hypothetical protein ACK5KR_03455 [Breznakia sp.]
MKDEVIIRAVELIMQELKKYEVIKKLVDTNDNKNVAMRKLQCTRRTINQLIIVYKNQGKQEFRHKNKGRKPAAIFSNEDKQKIVDMYINGFQDTNLDISVKLFLLTYISKSLIPL